MANTISPNSNRQTASTDPPPDNANPSKFFTNFLFKSLLITVFLVLLPIFPSIAPEFVNQTLHARSWELLQLILVGIAVSYGLFSRKNDEILEKDNTNNYGSKVDSAQSYVSKLLQVSSVFEDETETESETVIDDNNKVQTWSSQYRRGEPVVVVAKKSPVVGEENDAVSELSQKPLLLPVRSLKQRVSEGDGDRNESGTKNRLSASPGSRRISRNSTRSRNEDAEGLNDEDNVVLRSPIPWRSRSGRMVVDENGDGAGEFVVSPLIDEQELSGVESRSFKKPPKPKPRSKNLSPTMSFSTESSQPRNGDDFVKKKDLPPPPPPPPPPPTSPYVRRPVLTKSNSTVVTNAPVNSKKALRRSVRSMPTEELIEPEMEEPVRRVNPGGWTLNDVPPLGRSVRTFRTNEMVLEVDNKPMNLNAKLPNELVEKVIVDSSSDDDNSETDDEVVNVGGSLENGEAASEDNGGSELGPDVDKKADEFIAKFREQIRLQRIESIRRSTAQRSGRVFR